MTDNSQNDRNPGNAPQAVPDLSDDEMDILTSYARNRFSMGRGFGHKRAKPSGISLKNQDAAIVKGMLKRGDRQSDIAAFFGVNGGRVSEIAKGKTFESVAAVYENLPPPGPYRPARFWYANEKIGAFIRDVRGKIDELERDLKKI